MWVYRGSDDAVEACTVYTYRGGNECVCVCVWRGQFAGIMVTDLILRTAGASLVSYDPRPGVLGPVYCTTVNISIKLLPITHEIHTVHQSY